MNLSGLILTLFLVASVVLSSGCTKNECKYNEDCSYKNCFSAHCDDGLCIYNALPTCCGDNVCTQGEHHSNCAQDCPMCDDQNPNTEDFFDYDMQHCKNVPLYYIFEDFEMGASKWSFSDENGEPIEPWNLVSGETNQMLRGTGHSWATLMDGEWDDYTFKSSFSIMQGVVHFSYRKKDSPEGVMRYFVGIGNNKVYLQKEYKGQFHQLSEIKTYVGPGWHSVEIRGYNNLLNVYLDGALLIKYTDYTEPIISGGIAFEPLENTLFLADDVIVKRAGMNELIGPDNPAGNPPPPN